MVDYFSVFKLADYRQIIFVTNDDDWVDKPLTRILPELHEDNDDLFLLNSNTNSTSLKIKKKSVAVSKNDVVSEKFGSQVR